MQKYPQISEYFETLNIVTSLKFTSNRMQFVTSKTHKHKYDKQINKYFDLSMFEQMFDLRRKYFSKN